MASISKRSPLLDGVLVATLTAALTAADAVGTGGTSGGFVHAERQNADPKRAARSMASYNPTTAPTGKIVLEGP